VIAKESPGQGPCPPLVYQNPSQVSDRTNQLSAFSLDRQRSLVWKWPVKYSVHYRLVRPVR